MKKLSQKFGFQVFKTRNQLLGLLRPQQTARMAADLFLTPKRHPLKAWENDKEAQGKRIDLEGGLSAIQWGESPRSVLLVHGWESRATQLSGFVDSLLELGFQVIALDAPAHGYSAGRCANPVLFAKAIATADRQLGPFDGIVGHSMGGSAVGIALSEGVRCEKVVLISSPSSIEGVLKRFAGFIGLPGKCTKLFIQMVEEYAGRPAGELDVAVKLKDLKSIGLVIHDKNDIEVPFKDAESISQSWKHATLVATDGFGHRGIVRQPMVWNKVMEFFGEVVG
jgi:fermentation-respiration switch protein FrsA (DUF1100 family)